MRLLFWTALYWPYIGGVEVFSSKLMAALRGRGHEVAVVTSHGSLDLPDEDTHEGVPIHRMPFHSALRDRDVAAFMVARRRVAGVKALFAPEVVHINFSDPSVLFHLETAAAHPAPFLVTIHILPKHAVWLDTLLGRMLREADWVVAVSESIMADLSTLVPEIAGRTSVIYNGVETPALAPAPRPLEAPRLVCLGRVVRDKGFDVALEAFAELVPRFPEARLVVAGDGPARHELETQAQALGVADTVEFPGWVAPERVFELMNSATLAVMPSRWDEPFGLVAVEAALMARPVVASRVGGLAEVVADGETGLLVDKEDPAALARAVAHLLEDPGAAERMGQAARRRARKLFGFDRQVDAYVGLYQRLAEGAVPTGKT
jgi:glycosyltransferase involved in cell wall biosynthesis